MMRPVLFLWRFVRPLPVLLLSLASAQAQQAPASLTLNTFTAPPFSTPQQDGYTDILVKTIFARAGHPVRLKHYPQRRGIALANEGVEDGHYFRTKRVAKTHPNLMAVPVPAYRASFVAVTGDSTLEMEGWPSLARLHVGYPLGWLVFEERKDLFGRATYARSDLELLGLLNKSRVDVILSEEAYFNVLLKKYGTSHPRLSTFPLGGANTFIFLHQRHRALLPRLGEEIRAMVRDGSYSRICPPCVDLGPSLIGS